MGLPDGRFSRKAKLVHPRSCGLALVDSWGMARAGFTPRGLTAAEREVLELVIGELDEPARRRLKAQADRTVVVGGCDCGCATVDLQVDIAGERVDVPSPLPVDVDVLDERGETTGGILVFVDEQNRLSMLEIYSFEEPISAFPPRSQLRLIR